MPRFKTQKMMSKVKTWQSEREDEEQNGKADNKIFHGSTVFYSHEIAHKLFRDPESFIFLGKQKKDELLVRNNILILL